MKGVVLSAGLGKRLKPITETIPKPLIEIADGKTCLDIVIDSLQRVVDEIVIVVGYLGEKIKEYLSNKNFAIKVKVIKNPYYASEGNLTSLLTARPFIEKEEFILTNADHLFPSDFYTDYFKFEEGVIVAGQRKESREILEDEMKIRVDKNGNLKDISKTLKDYDGAYIGVTYVSNSALRDYWEAVDRIINKTDSNTICVEDVLRELIKEEKYPRVQWLDEVIWFEIDTIEDLKRAREGVKKW